ncbi:MAG: hypothetical protein V4608_02165 [Bacteroidota bacterium]
MLPLHLKNLCLSSLLFVLLVSCSPVAGYKLKGREVVTGSHVQTVINPNNSSLYKAKINLYNRYYSGLIVLKQTDSVTSHLVFITELGMKMFDFKIQNNELELVYVFEPLNKPNILKLLKRDMKLILLQHLLNKEATVYEAKDKTKRIFKIADGKLKHYYVVNSNIKTIEKTIVKGKVCVKEKVIYSYDEKLVAQQIKLKHSGFIRLRIELNKISKEIQ